MTSPKTPTQARLQSLANVQGARKPGATLHLAARRHPNKRSQSIPEILAAKTQRKTRLKTALLQKALQLLCRIVLRVTETHLGGLLLAVFPSLSLRGERLQLSPLRLSPSQHTRRPAQRHPHSAFHLSTTVQPSLRQIP